MTPGTPLSSRLRTNPGEVSSLNTAIGRTAAFCKQAADVASGHPVLPVDHQQIGRLPLKRALNLTPVLCFVKTREAVDLPQQRFESVASFRVRVKNRKRHGARKRLISTGVEAIILDHERAFATIFATHW
jgi:hypothetical protein